MTFKGTSKALPEAEHDADELQAALEA